MTNETIFKRVLQGFRWATEVSWALPTMLILCNTELLDICVMLANMAQVKEIQTSHLYYHSWRAGVHAKSYQGIRSWCTNTLCIKVSPSLQKTPHKKEWRSFHQKWLNRKLFATWKRENWRTIRSKDDGKINVYSAVSEYHQANIVTHTEVTGSKFKPKPKPDNVKTTISSENTHSAWSIHSSLECIHFTAKRVILSLRRIWFTKADLAFLTTVTSYGHKLWRF